jgi:RNA polymerase-binding transcription factor DksA
MATSKKPTAKKHAPAHAHKPAAHPPPKPAAKLPAAKPASARSAPAKKAMPAKKSHSQQDDLKRKILERKNVKAIAFTLDEVREIAKRNERRTDDGENKSAKAAKAANNHKRAAHGTHADRAHKPHHVKPASLVEILGFNPNKVKKHEEIAEENVPEKFRRYYRLLVDLRSHVLGQLDTHTEETLRKSAKEDSGDLSGYGQHMADAGTDTFDRDFALSLVSSEQEALAEIEAAIKRIRDGTYGVCEITGKPIAKERLVAVPFTRYSAEAQKQVERHSHRAQQRGGLFADTTPEEGGSKLGEEEAGED